jgi:hypothetical protein
VLLEDESHRRALSASVMMRPGSVRAAFSWGCGRGWRSIPCAIRAPAGCILRGHSVGSSGINFLVRVMAGAGTSNPAFVRDEEAGSSNLPTPTSLTRQKASFLIREAGLLSVRAPYVRQAHEKSHPAGSWTCACSRCRRGPRAPGAQCRRPRRSRGGRAHACRASRPSVQCRGNASNERWPRWSGSAFLCSAHSAGSSRSRMLTRLISRSLNGGFSSISASTEARNRRS